MKKIEIKKSEGATFKGVYIFTKTLITNQNRKLYHKILKFTYLEKNTSNLVKKFNLTGTKYVFENLIPTVGRALIANNLTNASPTNTMRLNYTSLGTGTNAPANGDTTLQTEIFRKTIGSETNANNIAYATAFYTAAEINGTFYEAGIFANATAAADDGVLFSRVLLNAPTGITKSNVETLTVDYVITIS